MLMKNYRRDNMDYEAGNLRIEIETNSFYVEAKRRFMAYSRENSRICYISILIE